MVYSVSFKEKKKTVGVETLSPGNLHTGLQKILEGKTFGHHVIHVDKKKEEESPEEKPKPNLAIIVIYKTANAKIGFYTVCTQSISYRTDGRVQVLTGTERKRMLQAFGSEGKTTSAWIGRPIPTSAAWKHHYLYILDDRLVSKKNARTSLLASLNLVDGGHPSATLYKVSINPNPGSPVCVTMDVYKDLVLDTLPVNTNIYHGNINFHRVMRKNEPPAKRAKVLGKGKEKGSSTTNTTNTTNMPQAFIGDLKLGAKATYTFLFYPSIFGPKLVAGLALKYRAYPVPFTVSKNGRRIAQLQVNNASTPVEFELLMDRREKKGGKASISLPVFPVA
jgi:hypothetical protein